MPALQQVVPGAGVGRPHQAPRVGDPLAQEHQDGALARQVRADVLSRAGAVRALPVRVDAAGRCQQAPHPDRVYQGLYGEQGGLLC